MINLSRTVRIWHDAQQGVAGERLAAPPELLSWASSDAIRPLQQSRSNRVGGVHEESSP